MNIRKSLALDTSNRNGLRGSKEFWNCFTMEKNPSEKSAKRTWRLIQTHRARASHFWSHAMAGWSKVDELPLGVYELRILNDS